MNSPNLPNIDIPFHRNQRCLGPSPSCCQAGGDLVNFSIDGNSFTVHVQGQTDSVTVSLSKDELESRTAPSPHAANTR